MTSGRSSDRRTGNDPFRSTSPGTKCPDLPTKCAAVVTLDGSKGGIEEFAQRQYDEVKTGHRLVVSEELPHAPLRVVPPNSLP